MAEDIEQIEEALNTEEYSRKGMLQILQREPVPPRHVVGRKFSPIRYTLSELLPSLVSTGMIELPKPKKIRKAYPEWFDHDEHCEFHQGTGYITDFCLELRHIVQDC